MLFLGLFSFVFLSRSLPALFGHRIGVVTEPEGITVLPLWSGSRRMRWRDVRLFEVATSVWQRGMSAPRYFLLHCEHDTLRWRADWKQGVSDQIDFFSPLGIKYSEMRRREVLPLAVIAARTGMRPRTFSWRLGARVATPARLQAQGIGMSILLVGLFGALAEFIITLPATNVAWLNTYLAVTVGGMAVLMLVRIVTSLRGLAAPPRPDPTFAYAHRAPADAQPSDMETMYLITSGRPLWQTTRIIVAGILLCGDGIPALGL
jgi:hypothetical protein